MKGSYCGKNCSECAFRARLNCPGCKDGPGKLISGDCEVANCCRNLQQEHCLVCKSKEQCIQITDCNKYPKMRLEKSEQLVMNLYSKVWPLFIITVILFVSDLVLNNYVTDKFIVLEIIKYLVEGICIFIYYLLFAITMGSESKYFRKSAIMFFLCVPVMIVGLILVFFIRNISTIVFFFPLVLLGFALLYCEYMGYSEILVGYDNALSTKWENLWKWYIGSYGVVVILAMAFSIISTVIMNRDTDMQLKYDMLNIFLLLMKIMNVAIGVFGFIFKIVKLVFLKKTVSCFQHLMKRNEMLNKQ